jgi:predicted HD superfamily hydrolase involved in NAD metabolism
MPYETGPLYPFFALYFKNTTLSGIVEWDAPRILTAHGLPRVAGHVGQVAVKAGALAAQFALDTHEAQTAGWLHDISAIIPNKDRLNLCAQLGVPVLAEEAEFPMLLHQKLSAVMAQEVFGVRETAVHYAIRCHTTLRPGAAPLDKLLFVADKIAWDQNGDPPYLAEIETAVAHSLDDACRVYLRWLWARRAQLRVIHPWFRAAHAELCAVT